MHGVYPSPAEILADRLNAIERCQTPATSAETVLNWRVEAYFAFAQQMRPAQVSRQAVRNLLTRYGETAKAELLARLQDPGETDDQN